MLPSIKFSLMAINSVVPVLRMIRPGYETSIAGWLENPLQGLQPSPQVSRDQLIKRGLYASQRALTRSLEMDDWWDEAMPVHHRGQTARGSRNSPTTIHTRFRDAGGESNGGLTNKMQEMLRGLVFSARWHPAIGQFGVCKQEWTEWFDGSISFGPELSKLRGRLGRWIFQVLVRQDPTVAAGRDEDATVDLVDRARFLQKYLISHERDQCPIHDKIEDIYYLDANLARVDWFEVLGAMETASLEQTAYQRAYAFFTAEQIFVRSADPKRTPEEYAANLANRVFAARGVDQSGRTLYQQRDLEHAAVVARTRWSARAGYIEMLLEAGHYDRAEMDYRLWLPTRADKSLITSGSRSDEDARRVLINTARREFYQTASQFEQNLDRIGSRLLPDGTTVAAAAVRRRAGVTVVRDKNYEKAFRDSIEKAVDLRQESYVVDSDQMRVLTVEVVRQVAARCNEGEESRLPKFEVVVALGRGGTRLAVGLCQVFGVRLMGTMAISRYADRQSAKGTAPYVRGIELPIVNARRILVCDDAIKSGATVEQVLPILKASYPRADIHVTAFLGDHATMERKKAETEAALKGNDTHVYWHAGVAVRLRKWQLPPDFINIDWAPIRINDSEG